MHPQWLWKTLRSSGVLVMRAHRALLFALPVAILVCFTLVVCLLAAREADFDFDLVAFPVHGDRHHGVTLALDGADQLVDLFLVQQQLARAAIIGDNVGRRTDQRRDRRTEQEDFAMI